MQATPLCSLFQIQLASSPSKDTPDSATIKDWSHTWWPRESKPSAVRQERQAQSIAAFHTLPLTAKLRILVAEKEQTSWAAGERGGLKDFQNIRWMRIWDMYEKDDGVDMLRFWNRFLVLYGIKESMVISNSTYTKHDKMVHVHSI